MSTPLKLKISSPDRDPAIFDIVPGVYTIGSDNDCKIVLAHHDIEGRHAILTVRDDDCWIEDLAGHSGTKVDDVAVSGRTEVAPGQKMVIGPYSLVLEGVQKEATDPDPITAAPPPTTSSAQPTEMTDLSSSALQEKRSIKQQIHKELVERLNIKRLSATRIGQEELNDKALAAIQAIVADVTDKLPTGIKADDLVQEVYDEAIRLGPLEELLADETVTEIMVNGPDTIYVERNGKLVLTDRTFMDSASVLATIERIVSPLGRRIDESQPYVDARLPDGSRVNAIIHPLSLIGPCLTIRKFAKTPFLDEDLIQFGTMTRHIADFMKLCILMRKNIVVSGGTGSGKTTLLNVFSSYLPDTDRILTIEDAAELRLRQRHVIRLEARPPNIEGKGAISIRDLVRNSLRMRPDRIVIGECRGGEALDMLQAMNTGHDGSLTTVHANSPRDVISRLETMVLMSGVDLPIRAIREQIASAIDVVVHESRFSDGTRKIQKISEIVGLEGDQITMQDIFEFNQTGIGEDGKVIGSFRPTGAVPTFIEEAHARGLTIDQTMFDPQRNND